MGDTEEDQRTILSAKLKDHPTIGYGKGMTTCGGHERKGMVCVDTNLERQRDWKSGSRAKQTSPDECFGLIKRDDSQMVQSTERRNV